MPDASIVIVTRDRREVAENAVLSALAQTDCDSEVVLLDDGSTDGTADYFREKYPTIRVARYDVQGGYILRRNQAFALASAPIIFSIDDDAVFTEPMIVRDILRQFDDEPRVGAVAIPFVNHYDGADHKDFAAPPDDTGDWVKNTFIGTAFALRKDIFTQLGGFQTALYHWAEESEYCQRLFATGYVVRAGRSAPIRHFPKGVGKYRRKVNRFIYRNFLLSAYFNAPARYFVPALAVAFVRAGKSIIQKPHETLAIIEGTAMGYGGLFKYHKLRRPLPLARYKLWLDTRAAKFVPMETIRTRLPAPVVTKRSTV